MSISKSNCSQKKYKKVIKTIERVGKKNIDIPTLANYFCNGK